MLLSSPFSDIVFMLLMFYFCFVIVDIAVYKQAAEVPFMDKAKIRALQKNMSATWHGTDSYENLKQDTLMRNCVNRVFTSEEENFLEDYVFQCSKVYFILSLTEVRKLVYELALKYKKIYPEKRNEDHTTG